MICADLLLTLDQAFVILFFAIIFWLELNIYLHSYFIYIAKIIKSQQKMSEFW